MSVTVYDLQGNQVATLYQGHMAAGPQRLVVDARTLAPGLYMLQLATESQRQSLRLMVR